jgi:hypothetical protein
MNFEIKSINKIRPTIEQLNDERNFEKIADFPTDDTLKFIVNPNGYGKIPEQKPNKKDQTLYGVFFLIMLISLGFCCGTYIFSGLKTGWNLLLAFVIFMLVVLPMHEGIHALVFRSFNANDVGFGFAPKAGMVYAFAQNFPISLKELIKVAVMPFVVISTILVIGMLAAPQFQFYFIFIFLIHTFVCFGDFALIKYALDNKKRDLYTYDDVKQAKRTYFFEKKNKQ